MLLCCTDKILSARCDIKQACSSASVCWWVFFFSFSFFSELRSWTTTYLLGAPNACPCLTPCGPPTNRGSNGPCLLPGATLFRPPGPADNTSSTRRKTPLSRRPSTAPTRDSLGIGGTSPKSSSTLGSPAIFLSLPHSTTNRPLLLLNKI